MANGPARLAARPAVTPLHHASEALALLLDDRVAAAEHTLRRALTASPPPPPAVRACLLSDLALCALHDSRPSEAVEALRHALAVLPAARTTSEDESAAHLSAARAQLSLNLCEALLIRGELRQALRSATEAVALAQHALQHAAPARRAAPPLMNTR